ncbi:nucleoside hydrolase [Metabacillus herbersteinensis]|uniref:Nucleoside hydrolase n=1 Tax=Metabacillus herbersteinensis TaxID=283816 RepID=A0ABV6GAB4_9BACI
MKKEKVLLFCDPGIDDSVAIIYALLNPKLDLVGIVTGYGNVDQEQATNNAAYLLDLAGRKDIPLIDGAKGPLSGEVSVFYPEIHGEEGLGPISPPDTIVGELLNFDEIFKIVEKYGNDLVIVDVGRSTSLAISFILGGEEVMNSAKSYHVMGGAFLIPGNVTSEAEANFNGDPIAADIIVTKAEKLTLYPLNITNEAIVTEEAVKYITDNSQNNFGPLFQGIYDYYYDAYKKLVPGIEGAPFHDVVALSGLVNPEIVRNSVRKKVQIERYGISVGESIADFRPIPKEDQPGVKSTIQLKLNYEAFIKDFMRVMTLPQQNSG